MSAELEHIAKDARRRALMTISRGVISAVNDDPRAQELQLRLLDSETADGIERFQEYGFTSAPHPDAEAIMACVGGLRSHGIVIAVEDRRYRLQSLQPGEVALYDDLGQVVRLTRDGITIFTPKDLTMTVQGDLSVDVTGAATVQAATIALAGGGPAVARVGDEVTVGDATGTITSGSAKVTSG